MYGAFKISGNKQVLVVIIASVLFPEVFYVFIPVGVFDKLVRHTELHV